VAARALESIPELLPGYGDARCRPLRFEPTDGKADIERYPRQLHKLERSEFLDMKRKEYMRQQAETQATTKPAPGA
jgi:hypothetical protein